VHTCLLLRDPRQALHMVGGRVSEVVEVSVCLSVLFGLLKETLFIITRFSSSSAGENGSERWAGVCAWHCLLSYTLNESNNGESIIKFVIIYMFFGSIQTASTFNRFIPFPRQAPH